MSHRDDRPDLYKEAGVDVEKGDRLVDWLQSSQSSGDAQKVMRYGETVSGIGGFAALFRPNFKGMEDPLLISGTDGVGTKVLLGIESGNVKGLGQDLVAMCVNDLYTIGGRPLFFLDYYATGALDEGQFKDVLTGIKGACAQSGCLLLGGETAEMPGLYEKGHFDLAGFVVGVVDGKTMLGPNHVRPGDRLYAFPASGFHSNGYSLVRKWVGNVKTADKTLIDRLLLPTRIYHEVPALVDELGINVFHALANITGGGISGNLPRVIPGTVDCHVTASALPTLPWMRDFIESKNTTVLAQEAVFNIGAGMIAAVAKDGASRFESAAKAAGIDVKEIGDVKERRTPAKEAEVHFH